MIGRPYSIVIDCPDPDALARFYEQVTGLPRAVDRGDWVVLQGEASGWRMAFQSAPDHQPPRWPDPDHPQQFHFDIWVEDVDVAQDRVLALGATRLPGDGDDFRVFADPAGHPFCLVFDVPEAEPPEAGQATGQAT